jgi:hypothetical protein
MVQEFHNQESEYEAFLSAGPAYVCNNLGLGAKWHRIHTSDCTMLNRAGPAKYGLHTSVKKACSRNLDELVEWLTARFSPEGTSFRYCAFCLGKLGVKTVSELGASCGSPRCMS